MCSTDKNNFPRYLYLYECKRVPRISFGFHIALMRVFENRALRRIFGTKRDGVMGGWKQLHNVELHNLYSLPSIIRDIKSRRMRWAGYVA
jgi:hypothetical protein